jgi:hypothetical protein
MSTPLNDYVRSNYPRLEVQRQKHGGLLCRASWCRANWRRLTRSPGSETCSHASGNARFSSSTNCCHTAGPQLAHSESLSAHGSGPLVPGCSCDEYCELVPEQIQSRRIWAITLGGYAANRSECFTCHRSPHTPSGTFTARGLGDQEFQRAGIAVIAASSSSSARAS